MRLEKAILTTLRYSDHFGFPLTKKEIHSRLISSEPCSEKQVFRTLKAMLSKHLISQTHHYYHLPARSQLITRREKRASTSLHLLHRARILAAKIAYIPGILAIYLTGSLAVKNSTEDGDIDFMIITQPGKLWTTRFLLTLYTSLTFLRRTPCSKHNSGKICLNLYLSPESYPLPLSRHSLYTAYELIQAVPLYDPQQTHGELLAANSWITSFLPNFSLPKLANLPAGQAGFRSLRSEEQNFFKRALESLLFHLQFSYMKSKITREHITKDSAFFHPHDPGVSVLKSLKII